MDTRGALRLVWNDDLRSFRIDTIDGDEAASPTQQIARWTVASDDWTNVLALYHVPMGVVSLYAGTEFLTSSGLVTFPCQIDWRLHHGVACGGWEKPADGGSFEQTPVAGSTLLKGGGTNPLSREGLLFQVGGLQADAFLLRARLRDNGTMGANTRVKITIDPRVQPGMGGSVMGVTVGSMIG